MSTPSTTCTSSSPQTRRAEAATGAMRSFSRDAGRDCSGSQDPSTAGTTQHPDASMSEHVEVAKELVHPFRVPAVMPVDMRFAARRTLQTATVGAWSTAQWAGIQQLAVECAPLDRQLRDRMSPEVHKVAGTMRLGLLCVLIHLIRLPDGQLPSLFVRASTPWTR